jgi:hypothetical protein
MLYYIVLCMIWSFTATNINKIFSRYQSCQLVKIRRRFLINWHNW